MFGDCYCFVFLPHGARDWSAVCDCGIDNNGHLLFAYGTLDPFVKCLKANLG